MSDAAGDTVTNTAWIIRGDWQAWPNLTLTRPNPPQWQLDWAGADPGWLLESSSELGAAANWQPVPGLPTRSIFGATHCVNAPAASSFFRLRKQ